MAKKKPKKRSKRSKRKDPINQVSKFINSRSIGILLVLSALLTLLSMLSASQGVLTDRWLELLRKGFGWGMYLVPFWLGALGVWLFLRSFGKEPPVVWERVLGVLIIFLATLPIIHMLHFSPEPEALAASGSGGGYVGYYVQHLLETNLGTAGAFALLLAVILIGLFVLLDISLDEVIRFFVLAWESISIWYRFKAPRSWLRRRGTVLEQRPLPLFNGRGTDSAAADAGSVAGQESRETQMPVAQAAQAQAGQAPAAQIPAEVRVVGQEAKAAEWQLPSLDLLDDSIEMELSSSEIRYKVRIIEDTLRSFGVPVKVVEVNQGPVITQFGIEPGYTERGERNGKVRRAKVKVNKISALANDLALALAASPIRIEAPIPGRSLVGLEVPNSEISLVSLKGVMATDAFREIGSNLAICLGQDVSGQPVVADLAAMPHLLIAGATGSGKSVCINALIACLLLNNTPEELNLIMVDPKRVELVNFNGIPHLLGRVIVEIDHVVGTLKWLTREMDRRYRLFSRIGVRNIAGHNQLAEARGEKKLPYMVILIDELADLMMSSPEEVERSVCRIAQLARATGIHLVIATQRPSVDVVTGLIKANFPSRISFAVTSQVDARVVLDGPGAEKLLGRGDGLYMASDSSKLVRLQGCFVSDEELQRLVHHWKIQTAKARPASVGPAVQKPLWDDMIAQVEKEERTRRDPLFEDAVGLVRKQGRASISLLQRRLGIGYSRAARLIDRMEDDGIVGPYEGAGTLREVLLPTADAGDDE